MAENGAGQPMATIGPEKERMAYESKRLDYDAKLQEMSESRRRDILIEALVDDIQAGRRSEPITIDNIAAAMAYQPWDAGQSKAGEAVREALTFAARAILLNVPAGAYRSVAIRKLLEARMDANAGISFRGRF